MDRARLKRIGSGFLVSSAAAAALTLVEAVESRMQFLSSGTPPDSFRWVLQRIAPVWVIFVSLLWIVRALVRRFPFDRRPLARTLAVHSLAALLFPIVHLGALGLARIANGESVSPRFLIGVIAYYYVREVVLYVFAVTAFHAIERSREARERRVAAAELQASLAEARLRTLRGQLSPHFLFNVLNTIGMLVRADRSEEALSLLSEFSDLLRAFLREPQTELVPLEHEVQFAERYLTLQRARFGDRMRVAFDIAAGTRGREVPSFVLYPLIENAVKHGLAKCAEAGAITVRARSDGDRLVLEVEDDGPGVTPGASAEGTGLGLVNLRARLANLYGSGASFALARGETIGSVARVVIPA
jgi:two-component system LytT family sensor kinase